MVIYSASRKRYSKNDCYRLAKFVFRYVSEYNGTSNVDAWRLKDNVEHILYMLNGKCCTTYECFTTIVYLMNVFKMTRLVPNGYGVKNTIRI